MGRIPEFSLTFPGETMYVPTGGMLPEGADGVVMIENTDKLDEITIVFCVIKIPLSQGLFYSYQQTKESFDCQDMAVKRQGY